MKRLALTISLAWIVGVTLIFQNCGGFKVNEIASGTTVPVLVKAALPGTPYNQMPSFQNLDYSVRTGNFKTDINQCLAGVDACVFWKSPYATSWMNKNLLSDPPAGDAPYDAELQNHQLFNVPLAAHATANGLRNAHFDVFYTDDGGLPQRLPLVNNRWQKSFSEGHSGATPVNQRFAIEQVQSFANLNMFRDFMVSDAGGFYASNGTIGIDAVSVAAGYNVNFDPITNTIYSGIRFGRSGRYYTLSQSSDLLIRELARANMYYGNSTLRTAKPSAVYAIPCNPNVGKPYFVTDGTNLTVYEGEVLKKLRATCGHANITNVSIYNYCSSENGCWKAIEQGQADFFTWVMYSTLPSIGETALPFSDVRYYKKRSNIRRTNIAENFGISYFDHFVGKQVQYAGDVKGMAELFAEILFDIYSDGTTDRLAFLKTISKFLAQVSTATSFVDAKAVMLSIDQMDHASRNAARIRAGFETRGY